MLHIRPSLLHSHFVRVHNLMLLVVDPQILRIVPQSIDSCIPDISIYATSFVQATL
jgi:hypothetical protein